MEFLIGLVGKGYVLVASDVLSVRSIMVLSSETSKLTLLSPSHILACVGETGEADRLKERLIAESSLATLRMGRPWTTHQTASFARSIVANSLRSRSPYGTQLLIAGVDRSEEAGAAPNLYWMDNLAALHKLPFAVHGYGAYFTYGLLDSKYHPDMTIEESISLIKAVIHELQTRFIIQLPRLSIKIIDHSGVRDVSLDNEEYLKPTKPMDVEHKMTIV